ncbi:MAG: BACON domain-containing protein [Bacteroidaceae bacterium]|nr:BACON domain-containing protein [Bacteroidaceae bacterium]MBP3375127.1 BACON domain-containing protein [Bacteroidaceae bacterium]
MKKNYLWKWLSVMMVATLGIFITSCEDDDPEPELSVSTTYVDMEASGGTSRITVTAKHTEWISEVTEGREWIKILNVDKQSVNIRIEANTVTKSRTGNIKVQATVDPNLHYIITINQKEGKASLKVTPSSVSFAKDGGSKTLTVESNTEWEVNGGNDWLTVTKQTPKMISLSAKKNESSDKLETSITVYTTDGECIQEIPVTLAPDDTPLTVSGLDAPFDAAKGSVETAQELNISCGSSWTISGKPDWLDISALSGTGKTTVKVWPNSANNSTSDRSATLTIKSGSKTVTKKVVQRAGLDASLNVSPNKIIELASGIALDFKFGSKVMYYYVRLFTPSTLDRVTDNEIIAVISSDPNDRDTPSDGYVTSWRDLDPQTEYILCTVGYDENGNHGALTKTKVTTKKGYNQAIAMISDVQYDDENWYWSTTVNGFVTKYYQWFIERDDLHASPDAAIAWFFKQAMEKTPEAFDPIVQSTSWNRKRNGGDIFHLATWALDVDGNFSGVIDNFAGQINYSEKQIRKNYVEKVDKFRRFKTLK